MRTLDLPDGTSIPALGLGTWRMGERRAEHARELAALRSALDMGFRLIDTAEMYGEGGAELLIGEGLADAMRAGDVSREDLFVVSKAYPHHAGRKSLPEACDRSLERLGLEQIDLYLLHWRGSVPLVETVDTMRDLVAKGRIRRWGVSNFDVDDLEELSAACGGHLDCAVNQVYFSVAERGPEHSLLPWQQRRAMPLMAYSPIDQGSLAQHAGLARLARRLGVSAAQMALAWVLSRSGVLAIPKAVREAHLADNLAAASLSLDDALLREIDSLFPPPRRKGPLAMI